MMLDLLISTAYACALRTTPVCLILDQIPGPRSRSKQGRHGHGTSTMVSTGVGPSLPILMIGTNAIGLSRRGEYAIAEEFTAPCPWRGHEEFDSTGTSPTLLLHPLASATRTLKPCGFRRAWPRIHPFLDFVGSPPRGPFPNPHRRRKRTIVHGAVHPALRGCVTKGFRWAEAF